MKILEGFEVVLCRAEEPGNVGAACRALKAMGLSRLSLAACPEYPEEAVRTLALHAWDVYASARRFASLGPALSGCSLAAGFTRRTGRIRAPSPLGVEEFARRAVSGKGRVALVFGNERDGLSREELGLCDVAVRIPTSGAFPSLNLAQAVQIASWELSRACRAREAKAAGREAGPGEAAGRALLDEAVREIADDLARIGFFKIAGRPELVRFLRSLLARAAVDGRELDYFRSLFRKTEALAARGRTEALTPDRGEARVSVEIPGTGVPEGERRCDE